MFAVALVAVVYLLLGAHHRAEMHWGNERRELLNRIQRPDYVPALVTDPERFTLPDDGPDEIELINTIAEPPGEGE